MATTRPEPKKPKRPRFTLAPLHLAVSLATGYVLLRIMVPALARVAGRAGPQQPASGWHGLTLQISDWVVANSHVCIAGGCVVIVAGFLLPVFLRPARYIVLALALAVIVFDIALVAGSVGHAYSTVLKEANQGR
jgi:hypothetical protein